MSQPASWREVVTDVFYKRSVIVKFALGFAIAIGVTEIGRRILLEKTPEIAAAVQERDRGILAKIKFRRGES